MADTLIFHALKKQPKILTLCNKNLEKVPKAIGKLDKVCQLQLKNNKLKSLPEELCLLNRLQVLNLGNNELEEFPSILQHLHSLEKLHLFGNKIMHIDSQAFNGFRHLLFLNLNGNKLQKLPAEICKLTSLRHLSLDNNQITKLPVEFCTLSTLQELHMAGNKLTSLPLEIGYLTGLKKLCLQKNKIRELPEGLSKCFRLRYLDVAANEIRIFPTELARLPLKEMYCEGNPLLHNMPVQSVQEEEVLSLKELCARFIMKEFKNRNAHIRKVMKLYPDVSAMLAQASKCAVCGDSFLNTWLECVQFVDVRKVSLWGLLPQHMAGMCPVCRCQEVSNNDTGFYDFLLVWKTMKL